MHASWIITLFERLLPALANVRGAIAPTAIMLFLTTINWHVNRALTVAHTTPVFVDAFPIVIPVLTADARFTGSPPAPVAANESAAHPEEGHLNGLHVSVVIAFE